MQGSLPPARRHGSLSRRGGFAGDAGPARRARRTHTVAAVGYKSRRAGGTYRPAVEQLEPRLLMTATPGELDNDPFRELLSHGGLCGCPICSGNGLEAIAAQEAKPSSNASLTRQATGTPTGLPQLASRPGAAATLVLDFDGHYESRWGSYSNVYTPAYDTDGDYTSFSAAEVTAIREIWARVAEDYAPFNINVTTIAPSSGRVARVAIGGSYSDWFGSAAGGVAYVGGYYNSASSVAYVFEDALGNGNARYTAEAASHEAGHLFGLLHQASWSGNQLTEEYNSGNGQWAPIMGVGYYGERTTWHNGPTNQSASSYQDDLSILAGANNGFGYVPDDYGNTTSTAAPLPISGTSVQASGLIGRSDDRDVFKFTTAGGALSFSLDVASFGANLDGVLELWNSAGQTIAVANPAGSLGASLAASVAAGTYYVVARSSGGYGNLGTYTLSGSLNPGAAVSPQINVAVGGTDVADGGTLSFGTTSVGTTARRTVTITNSGGGTLTLSPLSAASLPAGYSLVSNLGTTSLAAGQSTTFTLQLDATEAGTFGGPIAIASNDASASSFAIRLSGSVSAVAVQSGSRIIDNGDAGFATSGQWKKAQGAGHEKDIHWSQAGSGSAAATWTFSGLEAGQYRIAATWPGSRLYATNAPYSIYSGGQLLATVTANQQRAASTFSDAGSMWQNLGTFAIEGSTLTVRLTDAANGRVIADAVRIERVYSTSGGTAFRVPLPEDESTHDLLAAVLSGDSPASRRQLFDDAVANAMGDSAWQATLHSHWQFGLLGRYEAENSAADERSHESADEPALEVLADLAIESLLGELAV